MNETYTFNKSKIKLTFSTFLKFYSKYILFLSFLFLKLSKLYRKRSNKLKTKSVVLSEEAKGVSFKIIRARIMDINVLRLKIVTISNNVEKDTYFCYVFGDYYNKFRQGNGGIVEIDVEIPHYHIARDLHDTWKILKPYSNENLL